MSIFWRWMRRCGTTAPEVSEHVSGDLGKIQAEVRDPNVFFAEGYLIFLLLHHAAINAIRNTAVVLYVVHWLECCCLLLYGALSVVWQGRCRVWRDRVIGSTVKKPGGKNAVRDGQGESGEMTYV